MSALNAKVNKLTLYCADLERRLKVFEDKAALKALRKAEEERKRQEAEERKRQEEEEEKQRVEEQKRREEEMRLKFDGMFSDSKQMTQQQMATLRGFLEQYRG